MPLWVGPQAPCSSFATKISTNTQTAATQGTNDANAAVSAANALGFTRGTIIYYDIEAYDTSNSGCHNSVNAFLNAWVAQMRASGNQAGIYGSSCGSDATSWVFLGNIPNDVWLAAWDNRATVLGISCVSDGFWNQHQRIHQYKSPHNETWGGVTLSILSDCAEGLVAGRAYDDGNPNNC